MPKLENITKKYGDLSVFENFSLDIKENITTVVMGNSGIGKTTLLNVIAGLVPFSGNVEKADKISYVFQDPRLIDTMTVFQNLMFVMKNIKADGEYVKSEAERLLKLAGISDKKNSYPKELSAGQRQRVSLIRAFLYPSDLMLLDEPFASLDIRLKMRIMGLYKDLLKEKLRTVIFVSHDMDECLLLADEVIVLGKNAVTCRESIPRSDVPRDITDGSLVNLRNNIYNALLKE